MRRASLVIIYATALILPALLVRELRHRGGPYFEIPFTVEAHTWAAQNNTRDVLSLCKRARMLIPRGATVTVVRPSQGNDPTLYFAAVGNLPLQRVVPPQFEFNNDSKPKYVIAVREDLKRDDYIRTAVFPEGSLYIRR